MSDWNEYPLIEPEPEKEGKILKWYEVKMKDGEIYQACWWGCWYCFAGWNYIVAWRDIVKEQKASEG